MNQRALYRWSGYLFILPYLTLFSVFIALPVVFGWGLSFFQWEMLSQAPPQFVAGANYREALGDERFWAAMKATFKFVVLCVPLTVLIGLAISNALFHLKRRRSLYRTAYVLPILINVSVAGLIWRWFLNSEFGLFNAALSHFGWRVPWLTDVRWAMPSVVLMSLWWGLGGPVLVLLTGLQQIPDSPYEAAAIDGANGWQRFRHITLPLLKPVLLFVMMTHLIGAFQVFGQTFMVTRGGPMTSTRVAMQYIYETAFNFYRMGYGAALSWLLFAIIVVLSIGQSRLMRER